MGTIKVDVLVNETEEHLPLVVVAGNSPVSSAVIGWRRSGWIGRSCNAPSPHPFCGMNIWTLHICTVSTCICVAYIVYSALVTCSYFTCTCISHSVANTTEAERKFYETVLRKFDNSSSLSIRNLQKHTIQPTKPAQKRDCRTIPHGALSTSRELWIRRTQGRASFKLDMGAEVTAISKQTHQSLWKPKLLEPEKVLYGPLRLPLKTLEQFWGNLSYKGKACSEIACLWWRV